MSFPTTSVLDTFTVGADASPPNANWSRFGGGTADIKAFSATGKVSGPSAGNIGWDYWNPSTFGPDTEVGCTVSTIDAKKIWLYLGVTTPGTSSATGYRLEWAGVAGGANDTWHIDRVDTGGVATTLASATGNDLANGDKIGFERKGTVLTGYRWNGTSWASVLTYDISGDATKYTTAGNIALLIQSNVLMVDDFFGGTVVAAAFVPKPTSYQVI